MANEISFNIALSASKGGAQVSGSVSGNADLAGSEMISSVQTLATSAAAISLGGCDAVQFLYLRNMDAAIAITVGLDSPITQVISVIQPGKSVLLSGTSTTLYAKSASGTPDLFVVCVET